MSAAPQSAPIHWPDHAQTLTRIKGAAYRLLMAYAQRARRTGERLGEAWPSNTTLEADTGYSRRAVQYARAQLERRGILQIAGQDDLGRVVVRLSDPSLWLEGAGKPSIFSGGGGAKTPYRGVQKQRPNTLNLSTLNTPPTPRKAGAGEVGKVSGLKGSKPQAHPSEQSTQSHFTPPSPSAGQAPIAEKGDERDVHPSPARSDTDKIGEPEQTPPKVTPSEQAPAHTIPQSETPAHRARSDFRKIGEGDDNAALEAYREAAQRHGWPTPVGRLERPLRRAVAACGGLEAWRAMLASAGASAFWRVVIRDKGGICAAIRNAVKIANALPSPTVGAQAQDAPPSDQTGKPWQAARFGGLQAVTEAFEAIPADKRQTLEAQAKAAGVAMRIEVMRFALWSLRQERREALGGRQALEVRPWQAAKLGDFQAVQDAFHEIPRAQRDALAIEARAAGVAGKLETRRFAVWRVRGGLSST